jgi:hypothetical protein
MNWKDMEGMVMVYCKVLEENHEVFGQDSRPPDPEMN